VGADPSPGDFSGLHLADGTISIAYSHCVQIVRTLEPTKSERGMLRILLPKPVVLGGEPARLQRERREELPEPRRGIRLHLEIPSFFRTIDRKPAGSVRDHSCKPKPASVLTNSEVFFAHAATNTLKTVR
jgi:hypothetical protein